MSYGRIDGALGKEEKSGCMMMFGAVVVEYLCGIPVSTRKGDFEPFEI